MEDVEEYSQCDKVPFFVDTRRINIIETEISYTNAIHYARTDEENLFMYNSSLRIVYILVQCNVDIMSLNIYVLFHN
jgi:hypothetical protein